MKIDIAFLKEINSKPAAHRRHVLVVLCAIACLTESVGEFRRLTMLASDDDFADAVFTFIEAEALRDPSEERWIDAQFFAAREFSVLFNDAVICQNQREEESASYFADEVSHEKIGSLVRSDRRKSDLCRVAFRTLKNGGTASQLLTRLIEANAMLRAPIDKSDLQSLAQWCLKKHANEMEAAKAKRRGS